MLKLLLWKEFKSYQRSKVIWYVLTLSVIIPVFIMITSSIDPAFFTSPTIAFALLFKEFLGEKLAMLTSEQALGILVLFSTLPFLAPILGGYTALASAARSFAGEKESKTLEVLLALPVSDRAIFVSKMLSSIILGFISVSMVMLTSIIGIEMRYYLLTGKWIGIMHYAQFYLPFALTIPTILIASIVGAILSAFIKNVLAVLYAGGVVPALPTVGIILYSISNPQADITMLICGTSLILVASLPILATVASKLLGRSHLIS